MKKNILIGDRYIGEDHPVFIIAEMSANHAGDKVKAKEIIHAAKEAGADCIKVQTYTPDTLTINSTNKHFQIKKGTWKGENLYNLYKKAYMPWEWQAELKEEAEKIGLSFFSTAYEEKSVDFLEELGVNFYKVSSFGVTHLPFLKYLASKKKPIIMSTGMSTLGEIEEAVNTIKSAENEKLVLLKCSSAYPAVPGDMNLKTMQHLKETFGVPVGLSDHSLGSVAAITAVAMGAKVIEKHFCLSREITTPDSSFSMEPDEFKEMINNIRIAEKAIGKVNYQLTEREKTSRIFRRSIFSTKDIKKGEKISRDNIKIIRPGHGLQPKHYNLLLGKKANKDIKKGTPISWDLIGP